MQPEILVRNDNTVLLKGLTDPSTGSPINDAVVTWQVRTAKYPAGEMVDDGDGTHVASSSGDYKIDLDNALSIVAGTRYTLRVIAICTVGRFEAEDFFTAKARTGRTPTT